MSQEVLQNFTGLFKHCCPYCMSMYFTTHRTFMHQLKQPSYINEKHNKINMLKIKHATDAILPPAGKNELQFSGRFLSTFVFNLAVPYPISKSTLYFTISVKNT